MTAPYEPLQWGPPRENLAGLLAAGANAFIAAARPVSLADRVLCMAAFLQLRAGDESEVLLNGRDLSRELERARLAVSNIVTCLNTLMARTPPHIRRVELEGGAATRHHYRITDAGLEYVYWKIVHAQATAALAAAQPHSFLSLRERQITPN